MECRHFSAVLVQTMIHRVWGILPIGVFQEEDKSICHRWFWAHGKKFMFATSLSRECHSSRGWSLFAWFANRFASCAFYVSVDLFSGSLEIIYCGLLGRNWLCCGVCQKRRASSVDEATSWCAHFFLRIHFLYLFRMFETQWRLPFGSFPGVRIPNCVKESHWPSLYFRLCRDRLNLPRWLINSAAFRVQMRCVKFPVVLASDKLSL